MSAGCPHRRGPRARTPTRVVDMSARCPHRRALLTICMGYRHRRALLTPARVISPSRCQQPPHDVNAPLTVPTTRVHTRGSTRARAERAADTADNAHCPGEHPHQGQTPGGLLRIAHHPLGVRTQGPRFKKHAPHTRAESSPCVRPSVAQSPPLCAAPADTDTEKGRSEGADPPTGEANQQTGQPAKKGAANRIGPRPHHLGSRARTPSQEPPGPLKRLRAVPPATPRSGRTSGAWRRTGPGRPRWTGAPNPPTRGRTTRRRRAPGRTAPPGRGRVAPAGTLPGR